MRLTLTTLTLAAALATLVAGGTPRAAEPTPPDQQRGAGSALEIPPPASQHAAPISTPVAPGEQSTLEIPLPQVFRGCWHGVVENIDSLTMLGPPEISAWVPKTYRICYVRTADGPFHPTISEAGMLDSSGQLSNVRGVLKVISTDGRTSARMRALLRFDESGRSRFGYRRKVGAVEELTNMDCRIGGGVMHVEASVYGQWNGRPWCEMRWHADFANVPQ
jgi:hypothetical protein